MGLYLRKSIRVGPLRFNLSKSGIGLSTGVKGLRIGTGPRGNYVHMGRGGLYYRATIPNSTPKPSSSNRHHPNQQFAPQLPPGTHEQLKEIESADVSQIVDSSSKNLLDEIRRKQQIMRLFPLTAFASVGIIFFGLSKGWPPWLMAMILSGTVAGLVFAYYRDIMAKTVVVFYEFDSEMESAFKELNASLLSLARCSAVWHIEAEGMVLDRKYHAGAGSLVRRQKTFARRIEPPFVKTNIETIAIGVGRQTLFFFPDKVLVFDKKDAGAVSYGELRINISEKRFVETEEVPRDAKIVDKTWRYVNKSGGPDRRFKDNKELPVCLYEEISFSSKNGLNEIIQCSKCGSGKSVEDNIVMLGNKMPLEKQGDQLPELAVELA